MKKTKLALALAMAAGLAGCASSFDIHPEAEHGELRPGVEKAMQAVRGTTYVREIRTEDVAKKRPIYLTAQSKPLRSILQETLPGYAIIPRGKVNLNEPIDVAARGMTVEEFIEYLEGTRDLDIEIEGNRVYISNFETKEWNLAAFAATRSITTTVTSGQSSGASAGDSSGGDGGGSEETTRSTIGLTLTEDEWEKIMEGARAIIGAPEEAVAAAPQGGSDSTSINPGSSSGASQMVGNSGGGLNFDGGGAMPMAIAMPSSLTDSDEPTPYIEGIRSVGIVTAGGSPSKMRVLDRYFRKAIAESTKIVNVQVEAYDVVLNNDKQKGINWDTLVKGTINDNLFDLNIFQSTSAITSGTDPFWNVQGTYDSSKVSADFLIKFLETFGTVELQDQPNLTVRNGVPAQIYAGEELTYIVDVEQTQDESGNVTVTPKLGRLKVGVTLSVTVRVLDNDQLLVDVMPVISNLNAPDTIVIGDYNFQTPRVALKEFSTQLITTSGRSVHLGGLITKRLGKAMEHLPWQNLMTKAVVNPFTQNINNSLERRELVLVVTPTLVEGAM